VHLGDEPAVQIRHGGQVVRPQGGEHLGQLCHGPEILRARADIIMLLHPVVNPGQRPTRAPPLLRFILREAVI
jgi:hypothetical protein